MKKQLLYAVIAMVLTIGCGKKNMPSPQDGPDQPGAPTGSLAAGSIVGRMMPHPGPGVSLLASTMRSGQKSTINGNMDDNGNFVFAGLPAGSYVIELSANMRYLPLDPKDLTVLAGRQTDAGTVMLVPNPNNGTIVGSVSPANAALSISAQCIDPYQAMSFSGTVDPSTGKFELTNLPPGRWLVAVRPSNGFKDGQSPLATVSPGKASDVGTVRLEQGPVVFPILLSANGRNLRMNGRASYDGSALSLSGTYSRGAMNSIGDGSWKLSISLDQVKEPGVYSCSPSTSSKVTFTQNLYGMGANNGSWNSQVTGSEAKVVVTKIDVSSKTITGTFTASLNGSSRSARGKQELAMGSFVAAYN